MNKEMLQVVKSLSNERGVSEDVIIEAIEMALAAVAAKRYDQEVWLRVTIDRKSGEFETYRCWSVVADDEVDEESAGKEITLTEAQQHDSSLKVGDVIEEQVESEQLGRIGAQQVRQVIMQKVREAERAKIVKQYQHRLGDLVMGIVKRVTREGLTLDMGENAEAFLPRENMIPREAFRVNDRVRAYLSEVQEDKRGPQLRLSRTSPEFLMALFRIEVPEIGEEVIEIKGAARDPGLRAKIAVKTNDGRIDPIGACVGMRGSRVQAVSNELGGERIDIVLWDDNPAQLVINAMAPAEVTSIVVDEDTHTMEIAVSEEQLSQAIGRGGQNIRLASELTGWTLNVMADSAMSEKQEKELQELKELFIEKLDIEEPIADGLVSEGFSSIEEIAYVPPEELQKVPGFDESIVLRLQDRASDILLTQEIAQEEVIGDIEPLEEVLSLEGMTEQIARSLAAHGIVSRDDLAEQSVDELNELVEIDPELAAKLIMAARAHWFEDEE